MTLGVSGDLVELFCWSSAQLPWWLIMTSLIISPGRKIRNLMWGTVEGAYAVMHTSYVSKPIV